MDSVGKPGKIRKIELHGMCRDLYSLRCNAKWSALGDLQRDPVTKHLVLNTQQHTVGEAN